MSNSNNLVFYRVNPAFFYDANDDGYGDLSGFLKKIQYFPYLGVNAIIFPNLLTNQVPDAHYAFNYKTISARIGTLEDFQKVLKIGQTLNLKFLMEIDIATVNKNHEWFQRLLDPAAAQDEVAQIFIEVKNETEYDNAEYIAKTNTYYLVDSKTREIRINWTNKEVIEKFMDVVRYWVDLGVGGFVFTNFEKIFATDAIAKRSLNNEIVVNLRALYQSIKSIRADLLIVGYSDEVDDKAMQNLIVQNERIFDYVTTNFISRLGTHPKIGVDAIGKFTMAKLLRYLHKNITTEKLLVAFGSSVVGRMVSRWGDEDQYWKPSAKALALVQFLFSPNPVMIYYGDEIGMTNIGLGFYDNYQDTQIIERKNLLRSRNQIEDREFFAAQSLQNPINAHAPMQWNAHKNAGFSNAEKVVVPVAHTYQRINVRQQVHDKSSILSHYHKLIRVAINTQFQEFIHNSKRTLLRSKFSGRIRGFVWKNEQTDETLTLVSNFSKKIVRFKPPKNAWLLLSSFANYDRVVNMRHLHAFETIVFLCTTRDMSQTPIFGEQTRKLSRKKLPNTKPLEGMVEAVDEVGTVVRKLQHHYTVYLEKVIIRRRPLREFFPLPTVEVTPSVIEAKLRHISTINK